MEYKLQIFIFGLFNTLFLPVNRITTKPYFLSPKTGFFVLRIENQNPYFSIFNYL